MIFSWKPVKNHGNHKTSSQTSPKMHGSKMSRISAKWQPASRTKSSSSSSATWSRKKLSPPTKPSSTPSRAATIPPVPLNPRGPAGLEGGPRKKIATEIFSTSTSTSPASATCALSRSPSNTSSRMASTPEPKKIHTEDFFTPPFKNEPQKSLTEMLGNWPRSTELLTFNEFVPKSPETRGVTKRPTRHSALKSSNAIPMASSWNSET
mmetsp:Transcript_27311/g.56133  ORF Transcript_27311/g.56133 Transcript_27311/m.56133 type:complete len:208 (+) Transcript_27311:666-1289(+)